VMSFQLQNLVHWLECRQVNFQHVVCRWFVFLASRTPFWLVGDKLLYNSNYNFVQGILLHMVEMHCNITGHVQGVAFRTYAQEAATGLELVGYVKNLSDGSVEVVAQGFPDTLKEFVEYLHEGSLLSRVEGVAVEWRTPHKTFIEFSLLH